MKRLMLTTCVLVLLSTATAFAHCEIPCGIYGDEMRFDMIEENITTVEKSMNQIMELSKTGEKNYNQIVRWVTNKEEHARRIHDIAWQYFLTQRIKPVDNPDSKEGKDYLNKLRLIHEITVHAMKAKQTTDLMHVEKLRKLNSEFYKAYFGKEHKRHMH